MKEYGSFIHASRSKEETGICGIANVIVQTDKAIFLTNKTLKHQSKASTRTFYAS